MVRMVSMEHPTIGNALDLRRFTVGMVRGGKVWRGLGKLLLCH
jgi:hypothetical protein